MCPENKIETGKYNINIDQATGLVLGDHANVVQNFNIQRSTTSLPNICEVKSAIHSASSELRNYPNEIMGIHIERQEASKIFDWILDVDKNKKLGMIIDQPGGGKTVVMRDILEKLESKGISVLAIKSDNISGIKNLNDLTTRLALPLNILDCAREISKQELLVVMFDQLDALSFALSRDQTTLDIILSMLARLSEVDNIKIIASCRIFDLRNDPRLSKILVNHEFQLQPLKPEHIRSILQVLQLDPSLLLPAHWLLLSNPLHLEIFSKIIINSSINSLEKFRSLQDLFEALWQRYISITNPEKPSPSDRIKTIYQLVDVMQSSRQLSAPISALDDFAEETDYLERVGFIKREHGNWLFFHQTLFDYCYARRFVAKAEPLHVKIFSGSQGLFERSQMVQVLAYLRDSNYALFLEELKHLLFTDKLRVHLRMLLLGWFGSLPNPTSEEFQMAQRLIEKSEDRNSFFRVISGNLGWYELLNNMITTFLNSDDNQLVDAIIYYLNSLVELRTDSVLSLIKPFLGRSENWDNRIAIILSTVENWESTLAVDMACDLLSRGRYFSREILLFHNLAKFNPEAGCKILRCYFDFRLNVLRKESNDEEKNNYYQDKKLFGDLHAGVLIDAAVQGYPEKFLNELLPWFIKVVTLFNQTHRSDYYPTDPFFSSGWYGDHISEGAGIALRMADALKHIARTNPNGFRELAKAL